MLHPMRPIVHGDCIGIGSVFNVPLSLAMLDECPVLIFLEGEL